MNKNGLPVYTTRINEDLTVLILCVFQVNRRDAFWLYTMHKRTINYQHNVAFIPNDLHFRRLLNYCHKNDKFPKQYSGERETYPFGIIRCNCESFIVAKKTGTDKHYLVQNMA